MPEKMLCEYRAGLEDTAHRGSICVVDAAGRVVAAWGEVKRPVFMRSAAKPIQTLPFLLLGLDEAYHTTWEETAIMGASHLGEPFQVAIVAGFLEKLGLREEDMVLGASYPGSRAAARQVSGKRKIYHNCSGKHAALMAASRALGDPPGEYYKPDSRIGQMSLAAISRFCDQPAGSIPIGVDGCGVPIYALPLDRMALGYLRLAAPPLLADGADARAAEKMRTAYHRCPSVIRGTGTLCEAVNQDENLIGKLGANGVYCLGMAREQLGLAVKMEDGDIHCLPMVLAAALRQLGYPNTALLQRLDALYSSQVYNSQQRVVGEIRPVFSLA